MKKIYKCPNCVTEVDESELKTMCDYVDGWVSQEYYDTTCPCCECELEETIECDACGELVCKSQEINGLCDKCWVESYIDRFIKAREIVEELDSEIQLCNMLNRLNVYKKKDFLMICSVLGLKHIKQEPTYEGGKNHLVANYKDLEILCVCDE